MEKAYIWIVYVIGVSDLLGLNSVFVTISYFDFSLLSSSRPYEVSILRVFVSISLLLTSECFNQSSRNLVFVSKNASNYSALVCICQELHKHVPESTGTHNKRIIFRRAIFYAVRIFPKESSVGLFVYSFTVARQKQVKSNPVQRKNSLETSFSMRSVIKIVVIKPRVEAG